MSKIVVVVVLHGQYCVVNEMWLYKPHLKIGATKPKARKRYSSQFTNHQNHLKCIYLRGKREIVFNLTL